MQNIEMETKLFNKIRNDRGITLVALIITIIILIILAAITINALTHNDLAQMAIGGTEKYDKAQTDEMNMLNEIDAMVKETVKNLEDGTTKPKPEEPSNPWDKDDLDEVKVKDEDGNDVSIPKPEGTEIINPNDKVDDGIVMKDKNDNEWVWVPVDEATYNSMFAESKMPILLSGDTGVTTMRYTTSAVLIGSSSSNGKPGSAMSSREPDIVTDHDKLDYGQAEFDSLIDMATSLVSDYEKMINSIKKYDGFYIGRYELTANGLKTGTPMINTNWYNLYKECKYLVRDENKGMSRMIWRCQWDATCLWLENSGYNINNSSDYGNYSDGSGMKKTGSSDKYKTNNIYDLAGNVYEWTQEATQNANGHNLYRTYRGGCYSTSGTSIKQASGHSPNMEINFVRYSSNFHLEPIIMQLV